jgi:hypothetical protein
MDGSEAWEARLASRRRWRGWLVGGAVRLVLVAAFTVAYTMTEEDLARC